MILLTDVEGVLDKESKLVPSLSSRQADQLLASGAIAGGMIPKVKCALDALDAAPVSLSDYAGQVVIVPNARRALKSISAFVDKAAGKHGGDEVKRFKKW